MHSALPDYEALEDSWAKAQEARDAAFDEAYDSKREELLVDLDLWCEWMHSLTHGHEVNPLHVTSSYLRTDDIPDQPLHILVALMVSDPGPRGDTARILLRDKFLEAHEDYLTQQALEG